MVDFIDLIEFCKMHSNKLDNVVVYGRLTDEAVEPASLGDNVVKDANGVFCNFDMIAVNMSSYESELRELGLKSKDNIYFVNGSISLYVNSETPLNDWYEHKGTLRLATRVKTSSVIAMYGFYKDTKAWHIKPSNLIDIDLSLFSKDSRVYDYIMNSDKQGTLMLPTEVRALNKFYSSDKLHFTLSSGTATLLSDFTENKDVTKNHSVTKVKDDLSYTDSTEYRMNNKLKELGIVSDIAKESRNYFIALLKTNYSNEVLSPHIKSLISNIKQKYNGTGASYTLVGKSLIKRYLTSCNVNLYAEYMGIPLWNFFATYTTDILQCIAKGEEFESVGLAEDVIAKYIAPVEKFYAGLVGEITGLSIPTLQNLAGYLDKNGISFSRLLNANPYLLALVGNTLTIEEIEYLALCFGKAESCEESLAGNTIEDYRGIAIIASHLQGVLSTDTYICESDLATKVMGTTLYPKYYNLVQQKGYYFSDFIATSLGNYLTADLSFKDWSYTNKSHWVKQGQGYCRVLDITQVSRLLVAMEKLGIVVRFDTNLLSYWRVLDKALSCYKAVDKVASSTVDNLHELAEAMNSFTKENSLSESHFKAIDMLDNSVIAINGARGTHKNKLVGTLTNILKSSNASYKVVVASYTGKSDISLNNISNSNGLFPNDAVNSIDADCIIFKDMECVTLDNIYTVLSKASKCNRFIFLGDLNAVYKKERGTFFRYLLNLVPSVTLQLEDDADNLAVTLNKLINTTSTRVSLDSNEDFKLLNCDVESIPTTISLTAKYYMGTLTDDESTVLESKVNTSTLTHNNAIKSRNMQVTSFTSNKGYSWSDYNLNNILRGVFNTFSGNSFIWGGYNQRVSYKFGDRVQHTSVDSSSCYQRYTSITDGVLIKGEEVGVPVGSIGVIVGVLKAKSCIFKEVSKKATGENRLCPIRNDNKFVGNDKYFIAVRYYDSVSCEYYYILYRAYNDDKNITDYQSFIGGDASAFQLCYCSYIDNISDEHKIIISALGRLSSADQGYLSRSVLYAQWYKVQDTLVLVGDVGNIPDSQLSKIRSTPAILSMNSIGGLLCK